MQLDVEEARALAARAFLQVGAAEDAARDAAEILTLAEMMGIATHGLSRVRVYCDRIKAGGIDPSAVPAVTCPAPALRHVDGRNGLGPAVAQSALTAAMTAARSHGMGAAFCRGANHLGALAPYLWRATDAGFAAIITSTTAPMIAPAGGRDALIGNNPLGIGIPNPGNAPVLLDMALSVAARSRVRAAEKAGSSIPSTWATDKNGRPTTDPSEAMQGLMQAIGGAKGANFALCLDLLAAGLSGAAMLSAVPTAAAEPDQPQDLGQMFLLIDTGSLIPDGMLSNRMQNAAQTVTQSTPIDPEHPVRMPGARAFAALKAARVDGLHLSPDLLEDLRVLASA